MKNILSRALAVIGGKKSPEKIAARYLSEQLAQNIRPTVCRVLRSEWPGSLRGTYSELQKQMGDDRRKVVRLVGCSVPIPHNKEPSLGGSGLTVVGLTEDNEPVGFLCPW